MTGFHLILILNVLMAIGLIFTSVYFKNSKLANSPMPIPSKQREEFAILTPGCKIPKVDPYHSSIRRYIKDYRGKALNCSNQPMIISVNKTLLINKMHVLYTKHIKCQFRTINRKSEDNNTLTSPKLIDVKRGTVIKSEFIMGECLDEDSEQIYQDFFSFVQRKPAVEKRCIKALKSQKSKPLNVLLLGLDSVSKSSYKRHLHQVDNFIRKKLTYVELHGYNKLGTNTYPNMIPFHTGKLRKEFKFDHTKKDLSVLPMAWKEFAKKGYRTLFAEDCAPMASYNYLKRGFDKQPTDYYMRPFSIEVEASNMIKNWTKGCFYNRTEASVVYKWLQDFFDEFSPDPLFAYIFLTRQTHEDYNTVAYQDKPLKDLLNYFYSAGHLNRTIVFLFSDHGSRFGGIRTTYAGHLEDILPYFFLLLPSWFPRVYPEFMKNLKINERRLVTPLDMHRTMLNIASNFKSIKQEKPSSRSISLFTQIPGTRTCKIANIEELYCACVERQQISVEDSRAKTATKMIVKTINDITFEHRKVCVSLNLKKILKVLVHNVTTDSKTRVTYTNFLITFEVSPSGGIFQGLALYNHGNTRFSIEKEIDRVNMYGNQAWCIKDPFIRLFCYCSKQQ